MSVEAPKEAMTRGAGEASWALDHGVTPLGARNSKYLLKSIRT